MDPISACQRAVDDARAMIATVQPGELTASTPCEGWDVRGLINHMIGVCLSFTSGLQGVARDSGSSPAAAFGEGQDLVGSDPGAAYAQAAEALMQEWRAPGALEKTLTMSFGDMPAAMAARILAADQAIHAWDLARALGRPYTMDEDIAVATLALMQQFNGPEMRGPGKAFGTPIECSEDASVQDRLIAFSGRRP
jgi:uncharacterized protein (TIGR03086 family)